MESAWSNRRIENLLVTEHVKGILTLMVIDVRGIFANRDSRMYALSLAFSTILD